MPHPVRDGLIGVGQTGGPTTQPGAPELLQWLTDGGIPYALRGNAESDRAILMDRRDTSFLGTADEVTDEEVISAIKSVPCHY